MYLVLLVSCMWSEARKTHMRLKMNQPDPARSWRSLTVLISECIKDRDLKFSHNLYSSLKILLPKFEIDILDSLDTKRFSASYKLRQLSAVFFFITFDWKGNFKFWRFHWKDLAQIYRNQPYFILKYIFLSVKPNFYVKKSSTFFYSFFFRMASKI